MITAISILLFIAVTALMLYLLYRRSALDRLAAIPGEIVICEESGVGVDEKMARYYHYGSCLVRLTDRRIIIAQKIPFAKNAYFIRFVIDYRAPEPGVDVAGMVLTGYVPARVTPEQITVTPEGAGAAVTIGIQRPGGGPGRILTYTTERAGEYIRTFRVTG